MMRYVALIPARGGSKGLARKNLRALAGKPLLNHTIDAARGSRHVCGIHVSSEDAEILAAAAQADCQAVTRPAALGADTTTAAEVVHHFLENVALDDDDTIIYLQPTSPLRSSAHIDEAIAAMTAAGATSLASVVELEKSPFKSFVRGENGRLKSLFDEKFSNHNRQQLPKAYIPNGAIYIFPKSLFLARGGFPSEGSLPYVMSAADSVDIDTLADLDRAERLMEQRNG